MACSSAMTPSPGTMRCSAATISARRASTVSSDGGMATGIGTSWSFSLSLCPDHYSGKRQSWCAAASRAGLSAHSLVLRKSTNPMKFSGPSDLGWQRGILFFIGNWPPLREADSCSCSLVLARPVQRTAIKSDGPMIRGDSGRFALTPRHCGLISASAAFLFAGILTTGYAPPANALPSFARQTGQPCGACHTDFAGLTPYGRRFKIMGYTLGGGPYRTTLFPSDGSADSQKKAWVPPVAMMSIIGFTNTQAPQPPPTAPFSANNNVAVSPLSFFWGGAITDHIGAFAQFTYGGQPLGGFGGDPYGHTWGWDNTDIRYADTTHVGNFNVVYGITANNNPTVQDPWNTTPAWAFPYAASTVAPTPASARSSTVPLPRMSSASAPTPMSTTCSTSRRRCITPLPQCAERSRRRSI